MNTFFWYHPEYNAKKTASRYQNPGIFFHLPGYNNNNELMNYEKPCSIKNCKIVSAIQI